MVRTFSITMPSMVGIRGSRAGCRRKGVMFFMSVCLSVCHALELQSL